MGVTHTSCDDDLSDGAAATGTPQRMEGIVAGLVFIGVVLGSVGLGACMVLCAREHFSAVSERVRGFFRRGDADAAWISERARRDSNP